MLRRLAFGLLVLTFTMGHDHGGCDNPGTPTGAECDPRLRWDNFGSQFMTKYCTSCHSTGVSGGQRRGAPDDHNFDTQAGVQKDLDHVDEASASGPGAHNTYMPPYGPMPTNDERADLGRWIACGAP